MYVVLTTFPAQSSANVGDLLIERSIKSLIEAEKGESEFVTFFREEPLDDHLETINSARAVLMPAFPIRDTPMYPVTYQLVRDLSKIRVPLIPIGGNWNVYPGDDVSRERVRFSQETTDFLRLIADQVDVVSMREYHACRILHRHGITNTLMTGDPAWYDLSTLGRPMKRVTDVKRLVFSPPLSAYYVEQAEEVLAMLAQLFKGAERICAMHLADRKTVDASAKATRDAALNPEVAEKNARVRAAAGKHGFEVRDVSRDVNLIDFYRECDLHVGYECHAHLAFLRNRIPSVLIAEDARGVGFNYTLNVGGFDGFRRSQTATWETGQSPLTSGYCVNLSEFSLAPPRTGLAEEIRDFLQEELDSGFRRYVGLAAFLDETYEAAMRPFLASLP